MTSTSIDHVLALPPCVPCRPSHSCSISLGLLRINAILERELALAGELQRRRKVRGWLGGAGAGWGELLPRLPLLPLPERRLAMPAGGEPHICTCAARCCVLRQPALSLAPFFARCAGWFPTPARQLARALIPGPPPPPPPSPRHPMQLGEPDDEADKPLQTEIAQLRARRALRTLGLAQDLAGAALNLLRV